MKLKRYRSFALLLSILLLFSSCSLINTEGLFPSAPPSSEAPTVTSANADTTTEKPTGTNTPVTDAETLPADCAHSFGDAQIIRDATCTEEGSQVRVCSKCGGRSVEPIQKKEHSPTPNTDVEATCQKGGLSGGTHCSVCKAVLEEATATLPSVHRFSDGICTACGMREGSAEGLAYLSLYNSTYGYAYLGTMNKGEVRQSLYTRIDEAVRTFHTDPSLTATESDGAFVACTVNYGDLGLTDAEALQVWKTYRDDNPLYYWISNRITYNQEQLNVLAISDFASGTARITQNKVLYETVASYLALVPSSAESYETALILHDALIASIDYALDGSGQPEEAHWAHSIVGVFEGRGAVCEGFAKAFQLLMNLCEEDVIYVSGDGNGEAHAWNVIRINGVWYGVDVTWDDNNEETYPYLYFCLSEDAFSASHTEDLPTSGALDFLYAIPTLAEFSIEWVELYEGETYLGLYENLSAAFAAMTKPNGHYTVALCTDGDAEDGTRLHVPAKYRILDDLPTVASLTLIGAHVLSEDNTFRATMLYLTEDTVLNSDLTLKSIFLTAETDVTLTVGEHTLTARADSIYYSYVLPDHVTVVE